MRVEELKQHLILHAQQTTQEYTRLFHGRGHAYGAYPFLTVDSVDTVLFAVLFDHDDAEDALIAMLNDLYTQEKKWEAFILQRRYLPSSPSTLLAGSLPPQTYAIEKGLKYHVAFQNAQNIGFFPDMKIGREFVACHAQGKNVLNLFAYTCTFSVVALHAGATSVVNVDMNKNVLSLGRENHRLNGIETTNVQFMPYNILTSWSRIRKAGPYDLIIIDPPSFQKGSFAATHDYVKIIRRLHELAAQECIVLSALNAPELGSDFIKTLFQENVPEFGYVKRLENLASFPDIEEERGLKNLVFIKKNHYPSLQQHPFV
ncbi:MAG: class I SAM-dependent methyltransferase [Sulfuricurvum sp.]